MRERQGARIVERVAAADVGWKQLVWLMCGLPVEVAPPRLHARPWATWALAAMIAGGSLCGFGFGDEAFDALGLVPAHLWRFGGLTLATAFFLHENVWHLLVNLYFLLVFGDDVEDRVGRGRYLALIAVSVLAGGLAHAAIDARSTIPIIGASGGISGVIAFYALRFPRRRLRWVLGVAVPVRALGYGLVFDARASVILAMWLVLQLIGAATEITEEGEGGVANLAHLAGAATGVVFWALLRLTGPASRPRSGLALLRLRPGLGLGGGLAFRLRLLLLRLRLDALRKMRASRLAVPPLVDLGRDLALDEQLRELPALSLALDRHQDPP